MQRLSGLLQSLRQMGLKAKLLAGVYGAEPPEAPSF